MGIHSHGNQAISIRDTMWPSHTVRHTIAKKGKVQTDTVNFAGHSEANQDIKKFPAHTQTPRTRAGQVALMELVLAMAECTHSLVTPDSGFLAFVSCACMCVCVAHARAQYRKDQGQRLFCFPRVRGIHNKSSPGAPRQTQNQPGSRTRTHPLPQPGLQPRGCNHQHLPFQHLHHSLLHWTTGRNQVILISRCSEERISSFPVDQRNTSDFSEIDSLFTIQTIITNSCPTPACPRPIPPTFTSF